MEERRRMYDKNWDEILKFIQESRDYRGKDEIRQEYQLKSIVELSDKVKIQNGRIGKLEINDAKITGALAVITLGMPVILFMLNKLFK